MDEKRCLHVVMFPWLAMGHLIPFLELSKCLARKGHRISFVSTPRNIRRLPNIPTYLLPLINLVELPLPYVKNLLENAEATIDLPVNKVPYLKKAFDGLQYPLADLLETLLPDWIIYDIASYWLPSLANKLGIRCAFFSLFNASSVAYFGPPCKFTESNIDTMNVLEDLSILPKWMPVGSNVVLRCHEIARIRRNLGENVSEMEDGNRYGTAVLGSKVMFIRSCMEFEKDWIQLIEQEIHKKPVIPVGLLPPSAQENREEEVDKWMEISAWLDKHKQGSVVYVALGTEATLSQDEVNELALGLKLSNLPFFWVLRDPPSSVEGFLTLPFGSDDRTNERGYICKGWAPQARILAHPSVGGFLTHCGWNSIIESLAVGCPLILLPLISEQGLNARVLAEKNIGKEIPRDSKDGSFTKDSVAESLRTVITDKRGELFRSQAKEMRRIFGDKDLHDRYIDDFVQYLQQHLRQ